MPDLPFSPGQILRAADLNALETALSGASAFVAQGSGAVLRTVAAKLRDAVSVTDFGALGDGVADDTTAFRAAAARGTGIVVPRPAAFYRITGTISPVSGSFFRGDDSLPMLKMDSATNARMFDFLGVSAIGLRSLTLDGNHAVTPTSAMVRVRDTTGGLLEDLAIVNCPGDATGGVVMSGTTTRTRFVRLRFTGAEGSAVGLTGSSVVRNSVEDCEMSGGGGFGVRLGEGATRNKVLRNSAFDNLLEGVALAFGCNHNLVSSNHCEGAGDNGISISANYNVVTGNSCLYNDKAGIGVWGSWNTVTGNICVGNNQTNTTYWSGVWIDNGYGNTGQNNIVGMNICDDDQAVPTQYHSVKVEPNAYADWAATTAYAAGAYVRAALNVYRVTVGGTSGSAMPTHTTGTAVDGGVTWEFMSAHRTAATPRVNMVVFNMPGRTVSANTFFDASTWTNNMLYGYASDVRVNWPTSTSGLVSGQIWKDSGAGNALKVV
jgi:parallel beta-helix repeat protein